LANSPEKSLNLSSNAAHRKFLQTSMMKVKDPYPHFYLTFKIHKMLLKMRPVLVSVSGSLLHVLCCWLNIQLQPLVGKLPSFIASTSKLIPMPSSI
jgi:hypothetical protein